MNTARIMSRINLFRRQSNLTKKSFYHSTSISLKPKISVAIVGSGPSACYTAKYLTSTLQQQSKKGLLTGTNIDDLEKVDIDIIEKLPTPFGLVRSGVAPDHPEVKNVENDFAQLFATSKSEKEKNIESSIEFFGNVGVGTDVSVEELRSLYDVVVLAYGCESDRKLGIPGEDLEGVYSAREFVSWYNGHPDYVHMGEKFQKVLHDPRNSSVVVVGQGNVALDCARILAKGRNGLNDTDIAKHALEVIGDGVKTTTVLGRRGHVQGAFTIKELRELTKLGDTDFIVEISELEAGNTEATQAELDGKGARPKIRIDKLLRDTAETCGSGSNKKEKQVKLRFLLNPVEFVAKNSDDTRLGQVRCERTKLEGEAGHQRAVGTGGFEDISADMALVSIGFASIPLPGMDESNFDYKRGVVKNTHGKVHGVDKTFVSGWLKRGPSGIIGTNIVDAKDTVSSIIKDLQNVPEDEIQGRYGLHTLLSKKRVQYVDWDGFLKIDKEEKSKTRLRTDSQPREKFTNIDDMLKCL